MWFMKGNVQIRDLSLWFCEASPPSTSSNENELSGVFLGRLASQTRSYHKLKRLRLFNVPISDIATSARIAALIKTIPRLQTIEVRGSATPSSLIIPTSNSISNYNNRLRLDPKDVWQPILAALVENVNSLSQVGLYPGNDEDVLVDFASRLRCCALSSSGNGNTNTAAVNTVANAGSSGDNVNMNVDRNMDTITTTTPNNGNNGNNQNSNSGGNSFISGGSGFGFGATTTATTTTSVMGPRRSGGGGGGGAGGVGMGGRSREYAVGGTITSSFKNACRNVGGIRVVNGLVRDVFVDQIFTGRRRRKSVA